jgi:hypothetical protein
MVMYTKLHSKLVCESSFLIRHTCSITQLALVVFFSIYLILSSYSKLQGMLIK